LVQTQNGDWWAVFLGVRPYVDSHFNTGRETFLLPVSWEDDWPRILAPKTPLPWQPRRPDLPAPTDLPPPQTGNFVWRDDFNEPALDLEWVRVRTSPTEWWALDADSRQIRLDALPIALIERKQPAFLARRQQHRAFDASTRLELPQAAGVSAGLAAFQSAEFHYFLGVRRVSDGHEIFLEQVRDGETNELAQAALGEGSAQIVLGVEQEGARLGFYYQLDGEREWLKRDADATVLSTQVAGGFVGATLGIHARRSPYSE
jgi:alpha-N-arabinofuranosidase